MIYLYAETDSTNDRALEGAAEGAPHGACWVADRQTEGRGSREVGGERREWFSPAEANIYMSILLRPGMPPDEVTHMTLAAAAGATDAVADATDLDPWIKWPNDLFVGDRKLAGILTEAHTAGGEVDGVVVGLGINVNVASDAVPAHLRDVLTSIQIESGDRRDRLPLIFELRDAVVARCADFAEEGLEAVIDDVRARDRTDGRKVRVRRGDGYERGIARGVDESGHLAVDVDGETLELRAGEVQFL